MTINEFWQGLMLLSYRFAKDHDLPGEIKLSVEIGPWVRFTPEATPFYHEDMPCPICNVPAFIAAMHGELSAEDSANRATLAGTSGPLTAPELAALPPETPVTLAEYAELVGLVTPVPPPPPAGSARPATRRPGTHTRKSR